MLVVGSPIIKTASRVAYKSSGAQSAECGSAGRHLDNGSGTLEDSAPLVRQTFTSTLASSHERIP
jgi:hypothetical protein